MILKCYMIHLFIYIYIYILFEKNIYQSIAIIISCYLILKKTNDPNIWFLSDFINRIKPKKWWKNIKIWFVWWIDWITAGWCFGTWVLFFHILGIIFPTDFHIFRRGWNHQPDSNLRSSMISIDTWDHCEESNFTCQYHGVLSYEDHIAKGSVSGAITQYNWDKPGENPESQN